MKPLNIFYEEPDNDRWLPYDRYPRRILRRIVRGRPLPGGVKMVALGLMNGLKKLGVSYRFNDYRYADRHPDELVCIIGKPDALFSHPWKNPILFGAGVFSHPVDCPDLFDRYPNMRKILVPGEWMKDMFTPSYGDKVASWPVGIDTYEWNPGIKGPSQSVDFLIYDKIRWEHDKYSELLLKPIIKTLENKGLRYDIITYGSYKPKDLKQKLSTAKAVIFLCEHETQGIAYQQVLSSGTPILAWDRQGFWQDPYYFPSKAQYREVSSVPYWNDLCGERFKSFKDFEYRLDRFLNRQKQKEFNPRQYILDNLSLEVSTKQYLDIVKSLGF